MKIGDWCRPTRSANQLYLIFKVDGNAVGLVDATGRCHYGSFVGYTLLPECTGWDWKPVVDPGYRLIDIKVDTPQEGDEYLTPFNNEWRQRACSKRPYDGIENDHHTVYRRKVKVDPGEGYRLIDIKVDTPQEGDEFLTGDGTWQSRLSNGPFYAPSTVYRRKVVTYRPFKNKAEFKPHRDRWLVNDLTERRVEHFSDTGVNGMTWESLFRNRKFLNDDGTTEPCGVKL